MTRILSAFIGRDWAYQMISKFSFVGQLGSVLMMCAMLFFIGRTFGQTQHIKFINGGYFEFALIGIVFSRFQSVALNSFAAAIRRDQASGTIEAILVTRASVPSIVLGAAFSAFLFTAVQAVLFLIVGATVFHVDLHHANVPTATLVLILSMLAICPIGIAIAASVIAFRQGDAVLGIIAALTNVLGGVYFPIAVLPVPLKILSAVFPITHGLTALRAAILHGAGPAAVGGDVGILAAFAGLGIPFALVLFGISIKHARRVGSLAYV